MPNALMPEYVKEFQCIGGACEFNCCQFWNVYIDKKTYKKYVACPEPELKQKLLKNVKRYQQGASYAKIDLDKATGACPFQNEKGLCEIQLTMGEEALSDICASYPRSQNRIVIDDENREECELALRPSCPEVAQALMRTEPMGFLIDYSNSNFYTSSLHVASHLEYDAYRLARDSMIDILQDRRFPFQDRMVLLGMFISKIYEVGFNHVPDAVGYLESLTSSPDTPGYLFSLPGIPDLQFAAYTRILTHLLQHSVIKNYLDILTEFLQGLGQFTELTEQQKQSNFVEAIGKFQAQSGQFDHIFENYFVNEVFLKQRPVLLTLCSPAGSSHKNDLWEHYTVLCASYMLLKAHIAGICAKDASEENIARALYLYSRVLFQHSDQFISEVVGWLRENKTDNLPHMAALVRN